MINILKRKNERDKEEEKKLEGGASTKK